ncbi:hypothetical protein ADH76_20890 [Enterocloster clostridioformis]|uniref:hypothetical protein n=2 Tax=Enterocloster clostridioformis TaxID=1531 RepID=UPI00080CB116|nr:hypothetical protein [Enterocloster clostridioformis]ANU47221.1 hypothetical protein A4V08_16825 [Lachnoclostridium sp. YL32]WAK79650.1 hypothetical protein [Clostridium phage Villandry]ANU47398.1 hypothetical protein A4V08_17990 [Lachnoclostridium sp. YL32]NDO30978.1 hypothetical protein [Enterocloster clostridioformis]OXE66413.1 hypothetical protein ADH76_20890 [Enterocloster clostridioformis]
METGKETSMYTVSSHAKERYAERCKDRDSRLEITAYVAEHSQRIEEEINRMLRYGKRVYTGRTEGGKDRVDLGCGLDLDKLYVERMVQRLEEAKEHLDETRRKAEEQNRAYQAILQEGEGQIQEYQERIRLLKEMCEGYQAVMRSSRAGVARAADEVEAIVNTLIGKKKF